MKLFALIIALTFTGCVALGPSGLAAITVTLADPTRIVILESGYLDMSDFVPEGSD